MIIKLSMNVHRALQYLSLCYLGAINFKHTYNSDSITLFVFHAFATVLVAIGSACQLTASDVKYKHFNNKKHCFRLILIGTILLCIAIIVNIIGDVWYA